MKNSLMHLVRALRQINPKVRSCRHIRQSVLFLAIEKMVQERMFLHQGKLVVKDVDLAAIYGVKVIDIRTKIRENISRFPSDFMIETSKGEYALTEPGILMLGGLLRSERARRVHMQFIEYFVHLLHDNGMSVFDLIKTVKNEL
ncbi:MAG: ORF6N domain-containing protein [Bacteroidales bacterium]|nr:ORF6N domain-containing protein [Bacteroidales bacterium]